MADGWKGHDWRRLLVVSCHSACAAGGCAIHIAPCATRLVARGATRLVVPPTPCATLVAPPTPCTTWRCNNTCFILVAPPSPCTKTLHPATCCLMILPFLSSSWPAHMCVCAGVCVWGFAHVRVNACVWVGGMGGDGTSDNVPGQPSIWRLFARACPDAPPHLWFSFFLSLP